MPETQKHISEIIEMAWCDKTSFDNIYTITGHSERDVIQIMLQNLKPSSFRIWRKRVYGRAAKHIKRKEEKQIIRDDSIRFFNALKSDDTL